MQIVQKKNINENYKPKNIEDLDCNVFMKQKFKFLKKHTIIPNLLVSGPPGSGKTTTSKY